MSKNEVFRVYADEEAMLQVYARRLRMSDTRYDKGSSERKKFLRRYRNLVEEDQVTEEGHRVTVTTGIGIIDTMFASMVAVDVEFILSAIGHGTPISALVATRALNQAWKDTKGQQRAKRAIKDALLVDVGWVKVYYDYVEDTALRDKPQETILAELGEIGWKPGDDVPDDYDAAEAVDIVLRDRVCVDYVPWDMIRYDPTAKQIEDIRWTAQYTSMPEYEVKQHPVWRQFVKDRYGERKGPKMLDDVTGDTVVSTGLEVDLGINTDFGEDDYNDDNRITVVEMWDLESGLVTVFPKGHTDIVLHQRVNPLMFNLDLEDRNPFKPLIVRDDPATFEGLGDMRIIWPGLEELDEYRSNEATYFARTIPKVFGPEGALGASGKDAFKSPVWGEYVGLKDGYSKDMIGQVTIPPLSEKVLDIQDQVQFEMKESTGASEPMRGVFPSRRTTATETQIVTNAGEQRQAERRGQLEDWYVSIARTTLQLMQLFYDQERMLRYTDDVGQEFVWTWTKEDIAMDADLGISITPKENMTRAERVQRALQLMNLALPLPETDRGELIKYVAREMGVRDEDIRSIVKSDEEVKMEQQQQQAAQLAVAPQQSAGAPPGLSIS